LPVSSARLPGVDWLKAAAIVAVVFAHAGFFLFSPQATAWDRWLTGSWVWFHVPTFLLVSGFLYARPAGVGLPHVGRRLLRLWLPYGVASLAMFALGVAPFAGAGDALYRVASGSVLGHYYFVPLLSALILLIWPFSRLDPRVLLALLAAELGYAFATALRPGLALPVDPFWSARLPLGSFWLGYFLAGWLAAHYASALAPLARRWRAPLALLCLCAVAYWLAGMGGRLPRPLPLARVVYTLGAAGLILALAGEREPPRAVRFLSEASLAIYLFHLAFVLPLQPVVRGWEPPVRILFQAAFSLGACALLALAARALLGRARARRWLGA
jgi:peptidoglycan/LPS O-acetylase OafA/YrhL